MSTPTDEWMVTVRENGDKRRRFVIHHDLRDHPSMITSHAFATATATYSQGLFNLPGRWIQILSIVNQEA